MLLPEVEARRCPELFAVPRTCPRILHAQHIVAVVAQRHKIYLHFERLQHRYRFESHCRVVRSSSGGSIVPAASADVTADAVAAAVVEQMQVDARTGIVFAAEDACHESRTRADQPNMDVRRRMFTMHNGGE